MRRVNEQTTYESNYKSQQFKENLVMQIYEERLYQKTLLALFG